MKKSFIYGFVIAVVGVSLLMSCKKDKKPDAVDFNKGALLTNLADNLIIPGYNALYVSLGELEASFMVFQGDKSQANLEDVRTKWKSAYLIWQTVKMYDFGPAMDIGLKGALGTFPSDTTKIRNNIASGSYNLSSLANASAIGFSSLDFLLYQNHALTDFTNGTTYTQYALEVIQKMKAEVMSVKTGWLSYKATFIASSGNESTSAFSMLVNDFCQDFEEAKTAKLGIPIGKQSLGIQMPEYLEARFSGISFELMRKSFEALSKVYKGQAASDGQGFDDYLKALDKSSLDNTIQSKFNQILNSIDGFSGSLEENMSSNPNGLENLFQLVAGTVVYIKTDMTSAFGVLITYQDNDGD